MISNSGHDENGKLSGGKAGDQTGTEWQIQEWYNRPWTVVLRHPDSLVRETISDLATKAAKNNAIGYNQGDRYSYWTNLKSCKYDPSLITKPCNADCSAGVAANVKAAGYILGKPELKEVSIYSYTGNLRKALEKAGFKALTDSKYLTSDKHLLQGDILLYEGHHVATNVTNNAAEDKWYESVITTTGLTATADLNVRSGPSTNHSLKRTITKGMIIYPSAKTKYHDTWWVKLSDDEWLSMNYLKGWVNENERWWYLLGDGKYDYYKSTLATIAKKDYAFDKDGWLITKDRINDDGSVIY